MNQKEFYKKYNLFPLFKVVDEKDKYFNKEGKPKEVKAPIWGYKDEKYHINYIDNHKAYGLVCGEKSNIMVLDIDGEIEMLDRLLKEVNLTDEEIKQTKNTLIVKTPNGGYHLYFKYKKGLKNSVKFFENCDIRTEGGYIVAPYSIISNNEGKRATYTPINNNFINAMPIKLFDFIKNKDIAIKRRTGRPKKTFENDLRKLNGMKKGDGRNNALNKILFEYCNKYKIDDLGLIKIIARAINFNIFKEAEGGWETTAESVYKAIQERNINQDPVWREGNCYYKHSKNGGIPISNFVIEPIKFIECSEEPDMNILETIIHTQNGEAFKRCYNPTDFNKVDTFNNITNSLSTSFIGEKKELQYMKTIIYKEIPKKVKGVVVGGMHKVGDKWYFVTEKGAINKEGSIITNLVQVSSSGIKSNIIETDAISKEELKEISPLLFYFNSLEITTGIIGYLGSIFLKERLKKDHNIKFNHLIISGEAGAGKSQTVENIIMPILGYNSSVGQATGITKYVADMMGSSHNTLPFILEEYKPSKMEQWRLDLISNWIRSAYDGHTSMRGRKDLSTLELDLVTSLVLIGEASTDETAAVERSLLLTFSKKESYPRGEIYNKLKNSKFLPKLGRSLLNEALEISKEELNQLIKNIELKINDLKIEPRVLNTVKTSIVGIYMLEKVYKKHKLNFEEETGLVIEKILKILIDNVKAENLGGKERTKATVDKSLELISQALGKITILDFDHQPLVAGYTTKKEIGIKINDVYPETTKYLKDYGLPIKDLMKESDLKKQITKTSYFVEDSRVINVKVNKKTTSKRFTVINLEIAELEGLNLEGLKHYLEKIKLSNITQ